MALVPQQREDQLKFLGIVVLVGLTAIYWLYLYAPRSEELTLQEQRLERIQFENRRLEVRAGNLDELREELAVRRQALQRLERRIPSREEVAALYDGIARTSRDLDLELVSVSPRQAVRQEGEYFLRQRWSMVLEGDYHRVGRFLSEVGAMERIVRPSVSSVTPPEGGGSAQVRASVELETFVLPPRGPAGGETEGGAAAGADD